MAHRDVHGWLVFMAMVSLLDKLAIIGNIASVLHALTIDQGQGLLYP